MERPITTYNPDGFLSSIWQKGIFDGKVLFCTGGSGDICSSQTRALVYLGANACIVGRNKEKAERVAASIATVRPGAKVLAYGDVEVQDPKSLEDAVSKCVAQLGGIDFVIAGAAGTFLAPLLGVSTNAFKRVIDIDLMGSWNTVKATAPHLLRSAERFPGSGGRIIFISATLQYTGAPLNTHGIVAKAGVDALSVQVAIELGPRGVTSNVIAPGIIKGTEGQKRLFGEENHDQIKQIPSGRFGTVKDVNNATVYLFSEGGAYVNGTVAVVDGAAWHIGGSQSSSGIEYPACVLGDKFVSASTKSKSSKI